MIKNPFIREYFLLFWGIPTLILALGNFPERDLIKEIISYTVILSLFQLIGVLFLIQRNKLTISSLKASTIVKHHKNIGYIFIFILLFHPILLLAPSVLDTRISAIDAFITITTTYTPGIMWGILAWILMIILGITSFCRRKLPMKEKTWIFFHGVIAVLFITIATIHAINLGRHSNLFISSYMALLSVGGVIFYIRGFFKIKITE